MKIWLKLLIGSFLGIILGTILPSDNQAVLGALAWVESFAIDMGRYAVVPIMVFSLTIAVYELRQDGQFWSLVFRSFLVIIACAVFIIPAGVIVTLIFRPARIPILIEEQLEVISLNTARSVLELFPSNMFNALTGDGVYLLPVYVFAFFLGMGLSCDRNYSKPVTAMIDSLSRVFYHIASFFSEILGIIMIVLAAYWAARFHGVLKAEVFRDIIVLLGVFSVVVCFGVLPLLYGSLSQAITAFFSGDINFTLPVMLRHLKENAGCRRRSNAVTAALFTVFGRAGSAMVAAVAFIVIIKSYVSLGITGGAVFSIVMRAFLISFLLAGRPGDGAYTALAVLCLGYGHGYEAGYLILKPLAFFLIAIGTFMDVMIATFASCALARAGGFQEDKQIDHYI